MTSVFWLDIPLGIEAEIYLVLYVILLKVKRDCLNFFGKKEISGTKYLKS